MVFAQLVIQRDTDQLDTMPPMGTLLHPFNGKRVRIKLIQQEIVYTQTPVNVNIPFRVDFTGFQSNALSFLSQPPRQSIESRGDYPSLVSNSNGVGLILAQYSGAPTAKVFSTPIVLEGILLGATLSATLQVATKMPFVAGEGVSAELVPVSYVVLYLDIEPIN